MSVSALSCYASAKSAWSLAHAAPILSFWPDKRVCQANWVKRNLKHPTAVSRTLQLACQSEKNGAGSMVSIANLGIKGFLHISTVRAKENYLVNLAMVESKEVLRETDCAPRNASSSLNKLLLLAEQAADLHPLGTSSGPGIDGRDIGSEAESMAALLVDVKFGRNAMLPQGKIESDAVLRRHTGVGIGMKEKRRGSLFRDLLLIREACYQFRIRVIAQQIALRASMRRWLVENNDRIAEYREVGAAAGTLDCIVGVGIASVKMSGGRRCQMPACGESKDTDSLRIDPKLFCASAHSAQRPMRILKRRGMSIALSMVTVVENKRRYSQRVKPSGNVVPFVIHRQIAVTSARADYHRRPLRIVARGEVDNERRLVFGFIAQCSRSAIRPEQLSGRRRLVGPNREGNQGG